MFDGHLLRIENRVSFLTKTVGVAAYDFDFALHFECRHPYTIDEEQLCILRIGAPDDYASAYAQALDMGLRFVNSPAQHTLASELERWYPHLEGITPRTRVFDELPSAEAIEHEFAWPIFLKGSRQTSKHNPDIAIVRDAAHYRHVALAYARDPILHWQKPAIREFIELAPAPGTVVGKIRASIEFRSFWWNGACVGCGPYWYQLPAYTCDDLEAGLRLAGEAASLINVPFLVVDFAKTAHGDWIVIECNDAQESGHAGIPPQTLWRRVLDSIKA
jgi:hypothetical protein